MAPTFIDLFCGIGGFRIGLEAAGFECVYANDIDMAAVDVYKTNRRPDANYPVECADTRDVFHNRLDSIPSHHVLAGGFPCNSYSQLGRGLGDKCPRYGDLGQYIVKIAAVKRPYVVVLENVEAFFSPGRPWYKSMRAAFEKAGYVCSHSIVLAKEFGLPQNRRRGFIVAVREDVGGVPFNFPTIPKPNEVTLRGLLLAADCAMIEGSIKLDPAEVSIVWRMPTLPMPAWDDLLDKVPVALPKLHGLIKLGELGAPGSRRRAGIYHDLGHHPCITASAPTQKIWILTQGTVDEGPVIRKLQLPELRRIQEFPEGFDFYRTSNTRAQTQLGNAVPPPMVEWVGRAVAEQYGHAFLDEDNRDAVETPPGRNSSPKSSQNSEQKSKRKSKHKSTRKPRSKSRSKTRRTSGYKSSYKPRDESGRKSRRKRRLSLDPGEAPPPKRHHQQSSTSPDSQFVKSFAMATFGGDVEASTCG